MTVEDFLAQGGTITKCPTVFLEPSINARDLNTGIGKRYDAENALTWKERRKRAMIAAKASAKVGRKNNPTPGRQNEAARQRNEASRLAKLERLSKLRAQYERGESLDELARLNGCQIGRIRELLRESGIVFAAPVRTRKPPPEKKGRYRACDPEEVIRLYTVEKISILAIADRLGVSTITVRRITAKAGVTRPRGNKLYSPADMDRMEATRLQVHALMAAGKSFREIGKLLGIDKATAHRYSKIMEPLV
jgi:transposase